MSKHHIYQLQRTSKAGAQNIRKKAGCLPCGAKASVRLEGLSAPSSSQHHLTAFTQATREQPSGVTPADPQSCPG
ncbi:hypothetical protein AGIG_G5369 [Arapaima gigas]